jgi:digeranylgeranylglycerophospholipid reductase
LSSFRYAERLKDVIIVGGGPAGLSAAERSAARGLNVLVLEENHEIGSPIRTSGGSFADELDALGIPARLYHPISRVRFVSANNSAVFDYARPSLCVMDVRGVFQFLAERAIAAGANLRLSTRAVEPMMANSVVTGVRTSREELACKVLIDATGYRATLLKQAGLDPGYRRFGVGAEYDFYAPHCDQREALLIAGDEFAPSGYAWVFPWGRNRVRVGVGIIHPDSKAQPESYLDRLVANAARWGVNLHGAQPVEHHSGLIPSEPFASSFAGDGILGVGDAAGQASTLVGEGIRWAIQAGRMAGEVVAASIEKGDVSRSALSAFDKQWRKKFGANLRMAYRINQRIAKWDDAKWDQRLEVVKLLSPEQFSEALQSNLTGRWLWKFLATHPRALAYASSI